jgi:hypothetical protein
MMIVLGVEVTNARQFKHLGIRWARLRKETLRDVAEFWHGRCLDRHFTPGNDGRYQMQRRREFYVKEIKTKFGQGQGKWVSLLLRGKSLRWMRAFKTIGGTSTASVLRMRPPTYFGNPFIGTYRDAKGKTRQITQQPDKPTEVTRIDQTDRGSLRWYMQERLRSRLSAALFQGSGI